MTIPNWSDLTTDMTWYHYAGIGGAVVVILALLLYFTPLSRIKIPAIVMGIVGGLAVGIAAGVAIALTTVDYSANRERELAQKKDAAAAPAGGGGPPGMMARRGGGGPGGMGGGGGRGPMGGARGPSTKVQLAALISKLDLLTHKSLTLKLDAEQKTKVREAVQKLDAGQELSEDDARKKLDELHKILSEDQRNTLQDAGFRWPNQGGGRPGGAPQSPPNPFTEGENSQHLKSLLAALK